MIRKQISKTQRVVLGVACVVLLLGIYSYKSHEQHQKNAKDRTVPSLKQIWTHGVFKSFELDDLSEERPAQADSAATFRNLFLGLFFSIVIGGPLGILIGCFRPVEAFFLPSMTFLAKIPPTAAMAVFMVFVGTHETWLFVSIVCFGIIPTFAMSVQLAVHDVPDENLFKAQTLGASTCEIVWNVIFKQILPKIIDSIRLQIGPAMVFIMAAELFMANVGYGYTIRILTRRSNMEIVYFYLILLGTFGCLMDWALRLLSKKLCPWYTKEGR